MRKAVATTTTIAIRGGLKSTGSFEGGGDDEDDDDWSSGVLAEVGPVITA